MLKWKTEPCLILDWKKILFKYMEGKWLGKFPIRVAVEIQSSLLMGDALPNFILVENKKKENCCPRTNIIFPFEKSLICFPIRGVLPWDLSSKFHFNCPFAKGCIHPLLWKLGFKQNNSWLNLEVGTPNDIGALWRPRSDLLSMTSLAYPTLSGCVR